MRISRSQATGRSPRRRLNFANNFNSATIGNKKEMKRIWEIEKKKQRGEQNKKNRASNSGEGSATYAGGSIKIAEHRKRMADELGTELTYASTFERTCQKKEKKWSGDQVKAIKEKYDELSVTHTSGGNGAAVSEPSVDSMALWVEASGGIKRRKIFGMGSLSKVCTTKAATTSSSNASTLRRIRIEEQMAQELSQLKDLLVEKDEELRALKRQSSQKDEELRRINERHESLKSQIEFILRHLNLDPNQAPPLPPTN